MTLGGQVTACWRRLNDASTFQCMHEQLFGIARSEKELVQTSTHLGCHHWTTKRLCLPKKSCFVQMHVYILTNKIAKLRNINLPACRHLEFCRNTACKYQLCSWRNQYALRVWGKKTMKNIDFLFQNIIFKTSSFCLLPNEKYLPEALCPSTDIDCQF